MAETINIPRDTTIKELVELQKIAVAGGSSPAAADRCFKYLVSKATSKEEVDSLFIDWWNSQYDEKYTKVEMLERWFGRVLDDDRVHGVKTPLYETSTSTIGDLTDDSVGLSCTPSTATVAGKDDFAHLPQFWCLEVSAEKNEDGSHEIFYVEHIDDIADVRSGEHLTWVLQKNTYTKEYIEDGYKYLKMRCHPATGYKRWPQGKSRAGKTYAYMANPKYSAGYDKNGMITCGTGLAPVLLTSFTGGVSAWRKRGAQYSGVSGNLLTFLDKMIRLKYARKGNSGTIEGCTNYNYQYTAAVSETGVKRVILTASQASNLIVGSSVELGVQSGTDRNAASNYSICKNQRITKIEDITIEGTAYKAVYIDIDSTFDTTAGSTLLSTMPYYSGRNDDVLGTDGSRTNCTNGREPGMIQKVEFMHGAYLILSDELWQWSTDANGDYNFDCYTCHDQSKVSASGAITADYAKQDDITMVIPAETSSVWKSIGDLVITEDMAVLWPSNISAGGTGVGYKASFYCNPAASGVRAPWVFGTLRDGGNGGVACRYSDASVGLSYWSGSVGSPGIAG